MPQLVVNMNITLLYLIYLYTETLEILKRHAAYLNRYLQAWPTRNQAHLVFPNRKTQHQKSKEPDFANAEKETKICIKLIRLTISITH